MIRLIPHWLGKRLARFLLKERHLHNTSASTPAASLLTTLRVGDVLLVDGSSRASTAIKFITQSTWSHAALYVGDRLRNLSAGNAQHCFIEVDMADGVRSVDIEAFSGLHTRICRPEGLDAAGCQQVAEYAIERIGQQYDLRNIVDLVRYLFPTPPVPGRFRRRLLELGSGDPTRAICSTLIARAFQSVHYPILPVIEQHDITSADCPGCIEEIYRLRHHSLFTPRDFDVSPYFQIVKPVLAGGFDFKALHWEADKINAKISP
ncbi:MAG: YiiX/YebB-like N1pC/P60 family cysteine hydrolase [Pseudomonadota bacterium]